MLLSFSKIISMFVRSVVPFAFWLSAAKKCLVMQRFRLKNYLIICPTYNVSFIRPWTVGLGGRDKLVGMWEEAI